MMEIDFIKRATSAMAMLVITVAFSAFAQDPQFSQYYMAPLYLNPGFTGLVPQQRVTFNHRIQWPSLPQAFATSSASYDIFVPELRSGFGLMATTDKMGSAGWRTTTASLLYSYKVKLSKKIVFSPGLSFGYGSNGLDRSKLRLGDGLEYQKGDDYFSIDDAVKRLGSSSYFDFGAGFLIYSKMFWFGAAFSHINKPNLSVLNDVSRLGMKSTFHAGLKIPLGGGNPRAGSSGVDYLTPSLIYRVQGNTFSQLDIGLNYHIDPVSVGVWYRGKPWEKSVINSVSQDALVLTLGLYFKSLTVGYSYDFTLSELQTASGGAHEIAIMYQFVSKPVRKSSKQKYRLIPCPTFNSKEGFWN
jgi:type IX secretion system PorP/SprF family membrane protein